MRELLSLKGIGCAVVALLLLTTAGYAAPFTAVASGNWSAAATWGVSAPSFNNTADQIIIPAGITVTMDNAVTINGALASLNVAGTLTSAAATTLTVTQGVVTGTGSMNIGSLVLSEGATLLFAGALSVDDLTTSSTVVQVAANTTVRKNLKVTGGVLTLAGGALLGLSNDATITMSGGTIGLNGGALSLTNAYNVRYTTAAATTGLELSGTALHNVTVDVPQGAKVTLGSDLTIGATSALNLTSGTLALNGRTLTVNGGLTATANAALNSTATSSLIVNSTTGATGVLNFTGGTNAIKDLTINVGANQTVQANGALNVMNTLALTSGTLRLDGSTLTLSGNVTGSGSLSTNGSTNLIINTVGGISNAIRFAANGQTVNNLTVNVGNGNAVRIGSNLSVTGSTDLTAGDLNISDVSLTVGGDLIGTGKFVINGNSELVINSATGLTTPLTFAGTTIGGLTVNAGAGKTVSLGSDLTVSQSLSLQGGTLALNGNDLTLTGGLFASTTGAVNSTTASNITFASSTGAEGILRFSGTGNAVNNLTLNVGESNRARINGNLDVAGAFVLQSGKLNFAGGTLTLNGSVSGTGQLSTDTTANLVINTVGGVASGLRFAADGKSIKNLTINGGAGSNVNLMSDLVVNGATTLTTGTLTINDVNLSVGGAISGAGSIVSNANSGLTINTQGGLASPLSFTGGVIGNLGVNAGSIGTVKLGSDLVVTKTLTLTSGVLALNDNDLSVQGNVVGGITGSIRSTTASNISLTGSTGTTGILNFADNSVVGDLLVDVGATNSARIGGDITVMNSLSIVSGALNFNGADLTLSGVLSGTGALSADGNSNLSINSAGGLATGLRFAEDGNTINNLTIAVGAGNTVALASDLIVNGTADVGAGVLDISDDALILNGALSGSGMIATNGNSTIRILSANGINAPIALTGSELGELTVDVDANSTVRLGSDVNIAGVLDLESGTLNLNGNDLTLSGTLEESGTGVLASTNASNITINSAVSSTRSLLFQASANTVNNLTLSAGDAVNFAIGSDVNVTGTLKLTNGVLDIADNTLAIGADGTIEGGTTTSFVKTAIGGGLSMALDAGASVATVFPVGTTVGFFPANIQLQPASASGVVTVGAHAGVFAQGTTGSLITATSSAVNNTWDISSDIASNMKMNMELAWSADAEVNSFNRTQAYISHYTSAAWDASASASATARGDGMFSLTRTDIESLSPFAIFDGATTGVDEEEVASGYTVYPSPATDVVVVESPMATSTPVTVDIIDAQGRVVSSSMMNSPRYSINVVSLSNGVYFIRLHNEQASTTRRFVKI